MTNETLAWRRGCHAHWTAKSADIHTENGVLRTCRQCGATRPLGEFNRNSGSLLGHIHTCKSCKRSARAEMRAAPEAITRERELRSAWYENGGREIVRANTKEWRRKTGYPGWRDPASARARQLTQSAIRSGRLVRQPCEQCEATPTHAHHDDYTRPLVVRWLCQPCHTEWHRHNEPARAKFSEPT